MAKKRATTNSKSAYSVPSVSAEFAGAELGDPRRTKRVMALAEAVSAAPDRTLPEMMGNDAALEGCYRLTNNKFFGFAELMVSPRKATAARVAEYKTALVVTDLTEVSYRLEGDIRVGCGQLGNRQGFMVAASLALAGDGSYRPLGVLGASSWADESKKPKKKGKKKKGTSWGRVPSERWWKFVSDAEEFVPEGTRLIHVIDREAGTYELFHRIKEASSGFVIRLMKSRLVELEEEPGEVVKIREAAAQLKVLHEIEVPVSERDPKYLPQVNLPRKARVARLGFSAAPIRLNRSTHHARELPVSLEVNFVCVKELDPPKGEEPIEWLLATNEPIATVDDVKRVVEIYKARWMIEEFFKVLKSSGCRLESRQVETRAGLEKLLAIFLVVAWRLLLLRHEYRRNPDGPATGAFTDVELLVLRADGRVHLSKKPRLKEALQAVAKLGGHIRSNGNPGLRVLGRGFVRLTDLAVGYAMALADLGATSDR